MNIKQNCKKMILSASVHVRDCRAFASETEDRGCASQNHFCYPECCTCVDDDDAMMACFWNWSRAGEVTDCESDDVPAKRKPTNPIIINFFWSALESDLETSGLTTCEIRPKNSVNESAETESSLMTLLAPLEAKEVQPSITLTISVSTFMRDLSSGITTSDSWTPKH